MCVVPGREFLGRSPQVTWLHACCPRSLNVKLSPGMSPLVKHGYSHVVPGHWSLGMSPVPSWNVPLVICDPLSENPAHRVHLMKIQIRPEFGIVSRKFTHAPVKQQLGRLQKQLGKTSVIKVGAYIVSMEKKTNVYGLEASKIVFFERCWVKVALVTITSLICSK